LTTIFKEHRHKLKQIFLLAKNDLIKTYKGAFLGPLWSVVKPLTTLFVYWFAFDIGLRGSAPISGYPRFQFMLPAFVAWFFISDAILFGSSSIRSNSQFVNKMSFPVSTIMTFTLLSKMFVHLGLTVLMYIFLICTGYGPMLSNLQFFYYCPLMYLFFLALSWSTAPMSAFSRDFENLVKSITTPLFWFSSIIYNSYDMSPDWLRKLMYFNPVNYFVNGYRKSFLTGEGIFTRDWETIIFFAEFAVIIVIGIFNYKRLRKTLPDVL